MSSQVPSPQIDNLFNRQIDNVSVSVIGRKIIVPNNQMAANALKCPLRYGTSEDTITLNMVGGHNVNTQKFTITGLNWKLTPFDFAQDPRVAKCSVMCAPDNKTWKAVIHSTANIDSMIIKNKHFKPTEMTTKSKRCTKCQKHGHQKFQCKAKTPIYMRVLRGDSRFRQML